LIDTPTQSPLKGVDNVALLVNNRLSKYNSTILNIQTILQILRQHKPELMGKYPVARLAVFGSYARDEAFVNSDIDILVELTAPMGLNFIAMADEIEDLFGIKTDVIPLHLLSPQFLQSIEKDIIWV
jgi:predicted nucleotidyltransferase